MYLLQKSKSQISSRQQIDIRGVRDGVLILGNNNYRAVLCVSSINFELKSEDEQDALIETYESFLNSIGVPLQILIRTREIDMDKYLHELRDRLVGETGVIYKTQLQNYDEFIRSLIITNKILSHNFYVIVPYDASTKVDFSLAKEQLSLSTDIIIKGLSRLGMHSRELTNLELLDLFYSFYSPHQAKLQPLSDLALQVIHSLYTHRKQSDV